MTVTPKPVRIAVCAPAAPITREDAARVAALAAAEFPHIALTIHDQCFAVAGHFAGDDAVRLAAFLECANNPTVDSVWFARGGYGSNRIAGAAIAGLGPAAAGKTYLGYSDMGYLLGALYRAGVGRPAHGPLLADISRDGGEGAVRRALAFLGRPDFRESCGALETCSAEGRPVVAFNLTTLAMLCGTALMPDLAGHVVMVEEVSEHLYAIDRLFFHVTAHLAKVPGGVAGLMLGRVSDVPENDRPFGATAQDIAQDWCARHGIAYLGRADIGHDAANKIVSFGLAPKPEPQ